MSADGLPTADAAERAFLGAILIDGSLLKRVTPLLASEDFASEGHRLVYEACLALAGRREGVDLVTVQNELEKTGMLERVGGAAVLSALVDRVPDVENVESYARLVRESSLRRLVIFQSRRAIRDASAAPDIEIVIEGAKRDLDELRGDKERKKAESSPWFELGRFREWLREMERTRISTKIPTLDRATEGGVSGGTVVLFVGPIGSAKTALAHQLARDRGRVLRRRSYVYAPDQGGAQPLKRLASTFGNVAEDDLAFARFVASVEPVLRIVDERKTGVSIESFRDLVLGAGDVAAVVIDTPQTVATANDAEERQRIEKTMGIAREIAEKLLVPVFACSHANRAATAARKKEDRNLERSAGKGDASLEHRAQVVLFMERRDGPADRTEIDVLVVKAPIAHLRFRLLLDVETWTLREIDATEDTRETEERTKKARTEKQNSARGERREAIMAAVLGGPPEAGVSFARILEATGGRTGALKTTLDVMVEERLLETLNGPKPKHGGTTPTHYRVALSHRPIPTAERTSGRSLPPPVPLEVREGESATTLSPVLSEASFSTGETERERPR